MQQSTTITISDRASGTVTTEESVECVSLPPRYRFDNEGGRHTHLLDGRPLYGTSTIVGIIHKELAYWASGMALTPLGWLHKRKHKIAERLTAAERALGWIKFVTPREWMNALDESYCAHNTRKETAAVTGTSMHAELEAYVKCCIYEHAGEPIGYGHPSDNSYAVNIFAEWSFLNVREFLWSEAHCYSERLWTGGISDVGAILKDGTLAIIDFKSAKEAYKSNFVQMGGYATAIRENGLFTADGRTICTTAWFESGKGFGAFIVFPFGAADVKPDIRRNTAGFMRNFESAVDIYVNLLREFPDRGY